YIVALTDFFQQRGDVFGSMLQVAIHGDNYIPFGFVKAGRKRGRLSEIAAQADDFQVTVGFHEVGQEIEAAIGGGIVDEKDLVGALQLLQHRGETVVQGEDGRFLIVDGNHDRQDCHGNS